MIHDPPQRVTGQMFGLKAPASTRDVHHNSRKCVRSGLKPILNNDIKCLKPQLKLKLIFL